MIQLGVRLRSAMHSRLISRFIVHCTPDALVPLPEQGYDGVAVSPLWATLSGKERSPLGRSGRAAGPAGADTCRAVC